MPRNLFIGKTKAPTEQELSQRLGPRKKIWDQLVSQASSECGNGTQEWNSYSPKAGWSLRLKVKNRNIVYLSPCEDCLLASFALGDKAMQEAKSTDFPAAIRKILDGARKYAEGIAVRIPVMSAADVAVVNRLVAIKLLHQRTRKSCKQRA